MTNWRRANQPHEEKPWWVVYFLAPSDGLEVVRSMQILKIIYRAIVDIVQRAWCLPQSISVAVKRRRRQAIQAEAEAERLDRIRNPSKYLGK